MTEAHFYYGYLYDTYIRGISEKSHEDALLDAASILCDLVDQGICVKDIVNNVCISFKFSDNSRFDVEILNYEVQRIVLCVSLSKYMCNYGDRCSGCNLKSQHTPNYMENRLSKMHHVEDVFNDRGRMPHSRSKGTL